MSDWPDIEKALCDHLDARTNFAWTVEGGHLGDRMPLGIVQVAGGGHDLDLEWSPDVEITLIGRTRDSIWAMARQVTNVFVGLNPGGIHPDDGQPIHIDEARTVFGLRIDPDRGTATYRVAATTYSLTLRPQEEPTALEGATERSDR